MHEPRPAPRRAKAPPTTRQPPAARQQPPQQRQPPARTWNSLRHRPWWAGRADDVASDLPPNLPGAAAATPRQRLRRRRRPRRSCSPEWTRPTTRRGAWLLNLADKDERAVSGTPRDAALPEQESVAMEPRHCGRNLQPIGSPSTQSCASAAGKKAGRPGRWRAAGGGGQRSDAEKKPHASVTRPPPGWRLEGALDNLRQAMEYNRKPAAAKKKGIDTATLPPPPSEAVDERVACPHLPVRPPSRAAHPAQ